MAAAGQDVFDQLTVKPKISERNHLLLVFQLVNDELPKEILVLCRDLEVEVGQQIYERGLVQTQSAKKGILRQRLNKFGLDLTERRGAAPRPTFRPEDFH